MINEKEILKEMTILIDSREHEGKITENIIRYLDRKEVRCIVRKLDFGDYSFEYNGESFEEKFVIERKASLEEISGNLTRGRERFEKEFLRAKEKKARMILMVEQDYKNFRNWEFRMQLKNIINLAGFADMIQLITDLLEKNIAFGWKDVIETNYRTRMSNKAFYGSLLSFRSKYDLQIDFIPLKYSGLHILYNCYYFLRNELKGDENVKK
jgi:hypothetical protein